MKLRIISVISLIDLICLHNMKSKSRIIFIQTQGKLFLELSLTKFDWSDQSKLVLIKFLQMFFISTAFLHGNPCLAIELIKHIDFIDLFCHIADEKVNIVLRDLEAAMSEKLREGYDITAV